MFHPGSLQYYFLFLNKVLGDRKMNWLMWFDVYHESYKKKHLRDWVSWRTCDELQGCRFSCCFCLFIEALMELLYRFRINLVHSWCSQASEWLAGFALSEPVSHTAALGEAAEQTKSYSWKQKLNAECRIFVLENVLLYFVY